MPALPPVQTSGRSSVVDCVTSCTIENIILERAANGVYTVKLHYYSDHVRGPSSPRMGNRQLDFGPQQMTNDQVWDVATIDWPAGRVLITDRVRDRLPGETFPAKPWPRRVLSRRARADRIQ